MEILFTIVAILCFVLLGAGFSCMMAVNLNARHHDLVSRRKNLAERQKKWELDASERERNKQERAAQTAELNRVAEESRARRTMIENYHLRGLQKTD